MRYKTLAGIQATCADIVGESFDYLVAKPGQTFNPISSADRRRLQPAVGSDRACRVWSCLLSIGLRPPPTQRLS